MRIAYVITTLDRGGAEHHLLSLVSALRQAGHEIAVFGLRGQGELLEEFRQVGCFAEILGLRFYADFCVARRLRRALEAFNPEIVHAHMPPAELYSVLALNARSLRKTPLVISKHNDERFWRLPFPAIASRRVSARSAGVIAISTAVKEYQLRHHAVDRSREILVIRYGIDPSRFTTSPSGEFRSAHGLGPNDLLFLTIARLVPQKSLDTLLEAFAILTRKLKGKPLFLAIAGDGPLRSHLQKLAQELGIDSCTKFTGKLNDVRPALADANVFCLSSRYEGLGLVLLEAMAAAKPIVATQISAIPEIVVDGSTGLLVPPGNPQALAEALEKLADTALQARFGAAGRARVEEAFSIEAMVQKTLEVYQQILQKPGF